LDMIKIFGEITERWGIPVTIRVGIHTGSVVAGVIGKTKFVYDLWGDAVNTASRMESHGMPGKVHCSESVQSRLQDKFSFEDRGIIEVKGKGPMHTFFVIGEKNGKRF
ncbi:MAG TPA: adenylate/guanylate cyclase domain-containing protein, partial [Leptospiraceae bacterium]|nr:adenylate/guanylate cyclase domain-containing protein [Leptospiraceae bacterium]